MSAPSYASEPQVQYLHQILDQIGRAELLIPDFQRPPRWTDEQRRRLLESVSRGYPIGGLMVWRTSVEIPNRIKIGAHEISSDSRGGQQYQYLLDGFQRMSTLYAALRGGKPSTTKADADGHRWALGYHLLEEEWVFLDEVGDEEQAVVLPGYLLLDSVSLIRAQRALMDHPHVDRLLERSDALVRSLREYKLPVIPLVTDDLDEAIRTFGLLNTEGTRMSDFDLVAALTWRKDYDLRGKLDDAKKALGRVGWEELDEKYIIATLRSAFDLDLYARDGNAKELGERLRTEPEVLQSAIDGLADAGAFLRDRCGVVALDLLPYSYQAVILGDVMRRYPVRSPELETALEQWFWWTTAWSTFAGISGYRMNSMLAYLRLLGAGEEARWPFRMTNAKPAPLPLTADPRAARTRALALHLFREMGRPADVRRRLEGHAGRALVRGLANLPASVARDPGNAFLVSFEDEVALLSALEEQRHGGMGSTIMGSTIVLKLKEDGILAEAQISKDAWAELGRGNAKGFIERRRRALEAMEEAFLEGLGLPPGME